MKKARTTAAVNKKEKLALFDSLLDCAGITALICQVWNGLVVQVSRNFVNTEGPTLGGF